mgnify:CR=1 FL=1
MAKVENTSRGVKYVRASQTPMVPNMTNRPFLTPNSLIDISKSPAIDLMSTLNFLSASA